MKFSDLFISSSPSLSILKFSSSSILKFSKLIVFFCTFPYWFKVSRFFVAIYLPWVCRQILHQFKFGSNLSSEVITFIRCSYLMRATMYNGSTNNSSSIIQDKTPCYFVAFSRRAPRGFWCCDGVVFPLVVFLLFLTLWWTIARFTLSSIYPFCTFRPAHPRVIRNFLPRVIGLSASLLFPTCHYSSVSQDFRGQLCAPSILMRIHRRVETSSLAASKSRSFHFTIY